MSEYTFSNDFIERYRGFLSSQQYQNVESYSKSDYWQYHANAVKIHISGNKITTSGQSGFYTPAQKGKINFTKKRVNKLIKNPSLLIPYLKMKMGLPTSEINLLSYADAFDKVMNHDPISNPDISSYRINFRKLKERPGTLSSTKDIRNQYYARDKYKINNYIILAYYYYNILNGYIDLPKTKAILEIGAGNGNFISLLHRLVNGSKIIDVDLPETLSHAIPYIASLFPEAKLLFPNEIKNNSFELKNYDFIFLTPKQISLIKDNSVDLSINTASFQEMTRQQIEEYFNLIYRCGKNDSYFFTINRVDKIPCSPDSYDKGTSEPPNRFAEYPWDPNKHKTLIYEICRLTRLVQLDNSYLRLVQIKK